MKFKRTNIEGLLLIESPPATDARGSFGRLWCAQEFADTGRAFVPVQISIARNSRLGTLRGLHWQAHPYGETKLIRVVRGRIWDVIVDLRSCAHARFVWQSFELDASSGHSLLAPAGCAHGYITLSDDTDVLYAIDVAHRPEAARGARWNDPAFAIRWPIEPRVISDRDAHWPDFRAEENII
jgi:dTDP-4-dehydrorhamnose 3,5-epimerase